MNWLIVNIKSKIMKALYRYPLDRWEEYSTGFADVIFVNSGFTKQVSATAKRIFNKQL